MSWGTDYLPHCGLHSTKYGKLPTKRNNQTFSLYWTLYIFILYFFIPWNVFLLFLFFCFWNWNMLKSCLFPGLNFHFNPNASINSQFWQEKHLQFSAERRSAMRDLWIQHARLEENGQLFFKWKTHQEVLMQKRTLYIIKFKVFC